MAAQISLFDDIFSDVFGEDMPALKVEETTKKKTSSKKASSKKEEDKVTLPCKVFASTWCEELTPDSLNGKSEVTLTEVIEYLSPRYVELSMHQSVCVVEEGNIVCALSGVPSMNASPIYFVGDKEEIVIAQGQFTMSLDKSDLEGAKISDVAKRWEEQYPEFAECKLFYDITKGIGYPIAGEVVTGDSLISAGSVKYVYNGSLQELSLESDVSAAEVAKKITSVGSTTLYKSGDIYFPVIIRTTGKKSSSTTSKTSAPAKPKEEQKFKLPFRVTFSHTDDMNITSVQFPGKEEVTSKELQEYLLTQFEEYTEDKTEFIYFKNDSVVEARIKSAKRG